MKPQDWKKWPPRKRKRYAEALLFSPRGHYLVGKALAKAVALMREVPRPFREQSDIEDMEILLEELFPLGLAERNLPLPPEFREKREALLRELVKRSRLSEAGLRIALSW